MDATHPPEVTLTPWLDDGDVTLYHGDALETLREMPDESVDCVVTSPPYWGLRDYGTGEWDGGTPDCDHKQERREFAAGCVGCGAPMSQVTAGCKHCVDRALKRGLRGTPDKDYAPHDPARSDLPNPPAGWAERDATIRSFREVCGKCGARRVDRQMGLEPTPDLFVHNMVELFREIRRVLAPHGTCWVNLGDSYAQASARSGQSNDSHAYAHTDDGFRDERYSGGVNISAAQAGMKPKDLCGIPWRVAFALQADGWWLRSDIIWAKPNPMPESVTDRPTKAHEYVFLLTKQPRYWFDTEAVREPQSDGTLERFGNGGAPRKLHGNKHLPDGEPNVRSSGGQGVLAAGRNVRSVWQIATQPYPEAHFATFPEELARRCILAGCPVRVCRVCGKPSERIVEREAATPQRNGGDANWHKTERASRSGWEDGRAGGFYDAKREHVGWTECGCLVEDDGATGLSSDGKPGVPASSSTKYRPGVVLDPFIGSGTVAKVARDHQRHAIGIDLNQTYLELAARRLQQLSLLTGGAA